MKTLINIDDFTQRLVPLTYFRRNAGEVLENLSKKGILILTKDGRPIAKIIPAEKSVTENNTAANLAQLKRLAGGLHLGKGLTPKQINRLLDKRYEEMLPR